MTLPEGLVPYRDLRAGPGPERFIVEGALAVERLLASAYEVESLVCTPSQRPRLVVPPDVPVFELTRIEIAALAGFDFHRGVLACARRPAPRTVLDPAELDRLRARPRLCVVVAEGLADPRNLGALIRNAAAFGVDLVVADARGADLLSRLAIRASVGNVFRVETLVSADLPGTVRALARELDARVVAATPAPTAQVLRDYCRSRSASASQSQPKPGRSLVLVGNEGAGLSDRLLDLAHDQVRIPVVPDSDSINVAAATAVLLYEFLG